VYPQHPQHGLGGAASQSPSIRAIVPAYSNDNINLGKQKSIQFFVTLQDSFVASESAKSLFRNTM
jgi:hypothetical protein